MSDVAAMESSALEARGVAVGLPSGTIIQLLIKYGPVLVKLLLSLLEKQPEMKAPGDAQAFKTQLARVLDLAAYGANLTATDVDNRAVATLKQIVDNSDLVEFVFYLLGK